MKIVIRTFLCAIVFAACFAQAENKYKPYGEVTEMVNEYTASWAIADSGKRLAKVQKFFAEGGVYVDPIIQQNGGDQIQGTKALNTAMAEFQKQFPKATIKVRNIHQSGDYITWSWKLKSSIGKISGQNYAELDKDGKISRLISFMGLLQK